MIRTKQTHGAAAAAAAAALGLTLMLAAQGCKSDSGYTSNVAPQSGQPMMADDAVPATQPTGLTGTLNLSMNATPSMVMSALAVIEPTGENKVHGTVKFTQTTEGVTVVADISDLPPGKHGFHIHEYGDTSDRAKAMSEGGHYDPAGTHHHALVDADHADGGAHHAGDMGNLTADDSGSAHLEMTLNGVSLMGPTNPIVGRAVIIHEKADDGGQPTGNAGGRIGFGVIGIAKGS